MNELQKQFIEEYGARVSRGYDPFSRGTNVAVQKHKVGDIFMLNTHEINFPAGQQLSRWVYILVTGREKAKAFLTEKEAEAMRVLLNIDKPGTPKRIQDW